jgi:uncharacterized protein YceK
VAVAAVSLSGCGTVCNLARGFDHPDTDPKVYGGVAMDMEFLSKVANSGPAETEVENPRTIGAILAFGCIDPVFSLIGDTVTLPVTIPLQAKRQRSENKKNQAAATTPITRNADADGARRVESLPEVRSEPSAGP